MLLEHNDHDNENSLFLSSAESDSHIEKQPHDEPHAIDSKLRTRLMITLFAMVLSVEVGLVMASGPITRIYESIACREYYAQYNPKQIGSNGEVDEKLCKLKEIQSELAAVKGYMEFFDGILSILLAIPYGLLADRRGRKPTVCLSIPGFVLNCIIHFAVTWYSDIFPLRAVWASCLAWLFGGGPVVVLAIIWTMMSDVTTEEERASMFFKFGVASMAADFASNAASSWLMVMDPWLPLFAGWGVVIVGMFFALTLPETIRALPPSAQQVGTSIELSLLHNGDINRPVRKEQEWTDLNDLDSDQEESLLEKRSKWTFFTTIRTHARDYLTPYSFIFENKKILLLLTPFLVYRLSRGSWFLMQYISTRYNWSLAEANFLMSLKPALIIPLFLVILPGISSHMKGMDQIKKDLRLARVSIVCLTLGTLGIGLSPSIAAFIPSLLVQTCGSGFTFLTRSVITTLVKTEETARLYTIIEVLQAVGNVIASLSITAVFQVGLELGGMWIGLAWMMTSFVFVVVGLSIWMFRLPSSAKDDNVDREV
ncbi:hypothetical protein EYZ11_010863 [Aspergillus tanneri]|uniref:Major facilitator superfamily (MFS) profile domain-containing protein n=1 Tax=Aspergillus tanneri TaxID=1220188 RepID=A0A4S3J6F5_9EURO|nr:uncharacterized protein ATNIH1004_008202 [Aspergillus tanneri]KAA8644006.1 hypothetical protein ATNIH1004_008202 [Aspergillus tanneri]THC89688.1 hypothetical protein EYZ11_010863 [Aspergillus tanneri]